MVFATAHAEATVLGTTIRLTASADPRVGTALEVIEGKVRLARLADGATVEVEAGRFAVAAASTELAPRVAFPEDFVVNFGPANTPPSPQYHRLDAGGAFDPAKGFGWDASRDGEPIEKGMWVEQGKPVQRTKGRGTAARSLQKHGPLRGTDVYTGWEGHAETWKIQLPNGLYLVTVCVGDPLYEQGPHRVQVEDKVLVNNVITRETVNGGFYEGQALVEVVDGELTMKVGGCRGKSSDGSSDTILNYIAIKRMPVRGK
jgi:hypothetical protein